eukprot:4074932-Prymnesium_polylepis.1
MEEPEGAELSQSFSLAVQCGHIFPRGSRRARLRGEGTRERGDDSNGRFLVCGNHAGLSDHRAGSGVHHRPVPLLLQRADGHRPLLPPRAVVLQRVFYALTIVIRLRSRRHRFAAFAEPPVPSSRSSSSTEFAEEYWALQGMHENEDDHFAGVRRSNSYGLMSAL